jgi:hypothetical protein
VITYTNSNGCIITATVTVNPLPTPSFTAQAGASVCVGVDITYTTQTGQSSYVWTYTGVLGTDYSITSGGGNSNSVTLKWLTIGSKTVTVNYSNSNGCAATSPISSTPTNINPLPNDASNGFTGSTICAGDNGTLTFDALDASFVSPYTINYTDGTSNWSQTVPNASAFTFNVPANPATTTTYTLVSITNGNGCTTTNGFQDATAQIIVRPLPTATISGTTAVCLNASSPAITFTGAGGTAPYTFTYNINGGSNLTVNTISGNSVTVSVPTSATGSFVYSLVKVQDASSTTCSQLQTGSASITINPLPVIYTLTGSAICASAPNTGIITLNNSETGVSYQLKDGSNNNVQSAKTGTSGTALTWTGLAAGNGYYVVATGASPTNCSSQTSAINITSVTNPAVYMLTGSSICALSPNTGIITLSNSETGVSYQLKDSGNNDVQSAKTGTTGTALTWTSLAAGNGYYVIATGASPTNCPSQTSTTNVIVSLVPTASITQSSPVNICQNGTAYITGASASNGTILWTHNGSGTIAGGTTVTPTYTAVPADGGKTVTLTMTVSNNPCPQATAYYTINVSSADDVPITIGPAMAPICIGGTSAPLGASIGSGATTVLWTDGGIGGIFSPSATDVNATWKPPVMYSGTATLILTVTNSCGSNFKSKAIEVQSFPTVDRGPAMAAICQGSTTAALGGSVGGSATGGIWTSSAGGTFNPSATDVTNATWTPPAAYYGTAILTLTTTGSACDPISDTKSVVVDQMPVITTQPVDQLDCEGAFVNFSAIATTGTYVWQRKKPTDTGFITIPVEPNVTYPIPGTIRLQNVGNTDAPSGTQYRVIITNGSCSVISNSVTLTVNEITGVIPSVTNLSVTNAIICNGTNFNYQVTTSIPANVVSYQWKKWNNPGQWDNVVNGGVISGATTNQLTFTGATPLESGKYEVTVTFHSSGADCNVTSDTRTRVLTVLPPLTPPVISSAQTICSGTTPSQLTATAATGGSVTPSFTYQWQNSTDNSTWTDIAGATTLNYQPPVLATSTYYHIVATDNGAYACGASTSASVLILVNPIPTVNIPSKQSVCNSSLTSAVTFTGTATSYNWTNDTPSIGLAASGTGNIASFTATNSGNSTVTATISVTPVYTGGGVSCTGTTQTFTITVHPTPTVVAPIGLTYCNGVLSTPFNLTGTPASVVYDITGGAAIGLANQTDVPNIPAFTPIAGTAVLTVTPKINNCSGTPVTFNITVRPTPMATISGGTTVCQNSSPPPDITISNPQSLPILVHYNINGSGNYSANIVGNSSAAIPVSTSSAGTFAISLASVEFLTSPTCENTNITGTTTMTVVAPPSPAISGPSILCAGTSGAVYTTESGMANYSWNISSGGTITSGGTVTDNSVTVTWNTAGVRSVSVNYKNSSGCISPVPATYPVTVNPLPVPTIIGPNTVCAGTSKVYSTQTGMTNYKWVISSGGTIVSGGTTSDNTVTIVWNTPGNENVSINYTNSNGCSAASPTVYNVTVNSLPAPLLSGPTVACVGAVGNVYTTDVGKTNYLWTVSSGGTITGGGTFGSASATIQWNSSGAQWISINYSDANGCTASSSVLQNVIVNPLPVPTITGPDNMCAGMTGNVYTTEAGMTNYIWIVSAGGTITAGGTSTQSTVTVRWNTAGAQTVSVSYTNSNGCSPLAPTVKSLTVNPEVIPSLSGVSSVCAGFTGKVYTTQSGMSNYVWIVSSGGTITSGGTPTSNSVTIDWLTAGTQTVSVQYTTGSGCISRITSNNVTVNPLPVPAINGPNPACATTPANYSTDAGMTGYLWVVTGGTVTAGGSGNTATITWGAAGTGTITVTYTNSNSCTASKSVNVTINALPVVTCPSNSTVCISASSFALTGGTPLGGVYSGTGVSGGNFSPATAGVGTKTITYTYTDAVTGCSNSCNFTIKVDPIPSAAPQTVTICSGETTNIDLNALIPGASFTWTVAKVSGSDVTGTAACASSCSSTISQTLVNTSNSNPGVYRYMVTPTANGCTGSAFSVTVTVNPIIAPRNISWNSNFDQNNYEVCVGGSVLNDNDLDIIPTPGNNAYNGMNPRWEYALSPSGPWMPAPGSWVGSAYQWLVASQLMSQVGDYYFRFSLTNSYGCSSSSDIVEVHIISTIEVEAGPPLFVCSSASPSAITLSGAFVGGVSSTAKTGTWSRSPAVGTIAQNTSNPGAATFTPPVNYVGDITFTLTTNDPDGAGQCDPLTDTRIVHVLPTGYFTTCEAPVTWPLTNVNADGTVSIGCGVDLTGGNTGSGTPGTTDISHCSGGGNLTFDWSFTAPDNKVVWHIEDQQANSGTGGTSISVAKPTNLVSGDLVLVILHFSSNPGNIGAPSGFVQINRTPDSGGSATVVSYYKIAGASEPANYTFTTVNNVNGNSRIESVRITGFDSSNPIGLSNENTASGPPVINNYRTITVNSVNATASNSLLVAALSVGGTIEYPLSPSEMKTIYYNDSQTAARVATQYISGASGNKSFTWPYYTGVNGSSYAAAAQMFVINPAAPDVDAAYYSINGMQTLLGNTDGASGHVSVPVSSGNTVGFRVSTNTNNGGAGKLTIYNLTVPNDAPVVTGTATITVAGCQGSGYTPTFVAPTVTDDCTTTPTIKTGYPKDGTVAVNGCNRSQTRTWIYTDGCGIDSNTFTQTATWTVVSPLTVNKPADPNLPACSSSSAITTAYSTWKSGFAVGSGGCATVTTNIATIPVLGDLSCGGTVTFTYVATDGCGQVASTTQTFTVQSPTNLIVNCPTDPHLPACTGSATITAAYNAWKAGFTTSGGCGTITTNIASIPALTDLTCGGKLTFTFGATYSTTTCVYSVDCQSTFTVDPPTDLVVSVPSARSLPYCSTASDIQTAFDSWKAGFSASGGCGTVTTNMSSFPSLTNLTCSGTISFTLKADNAAGGCTDHAEGTSTFTVAQAPPLTVTCPPDPNLPGCSSASDVAIAYNNWVNGFKTSGGCNVTTNIASVPDLPAFLCNGTLTFTFTADNGSGVCADHASCTSTFTIGSAPPLVISSPGNQTISGCISDPAVMTAFNNWKAGFTYTGGCNPTATDLSIYTAPHACGTSLLVVYEVTDECGQSQSVTATFTVNPAPLSVTCPLNSIQAACQTQAAIDAAFAAWKSQFGYSGGCGVTAADLSGYFAPSACGGIIIINYSAYDACGQVENCSAIFTIDAPSNILQEPTFTVPADIALNKDVNCNFNADPSVTGVPTNLADNCTAAGSLSVTYTDSITGGSCAGSTLILRTWSVTDNCGNVTTKVQTISVNDNIAPTITCPGPVSGGTNAGQCYSTTVVLGTATASGDCSTPVITNDAPAQFPVGVTIVTWTATDACGNKATCTQTVTIHDDQPPVFTLGCPATTITQSALGGQCTATVSVPGPLVSDPCGELVSLTHNSPYSTNTNNADGNYPVGITTITWTATDASSNTTTCQQVVVVKDVTAPTIICPADATESATVNNCFKNLAAITNPTIFDSCTPVGSLSLTYTMTGATTGSGIGTVTNKVFNVGLTTVTYTVTDLAGNAASCSFAVTIKDVTPPGISIGCADVADVVSGNGCSMVPGAIQSPTLTDNCWATASLTLSYTMTGATTGSGVGSVVGKTFNVGVTTVIYTVTDPDGNSASCTFTVTIHSVIPPAISVGCANVTDAVSGTNCSVIPGSIASPTLTDNCHSTSSLTLTYTMTGATTGAGMGSVVGKTFNVGVTTVTYTVSDPDGLSSSCTFTVTILAATAPGISIGCANVTDTVSGNGCSMVPGTIQSPTLTDNCWATASLTLTYTMTGATTGSGVGSVVGKTFNVGVTTVTYTVSDPDGLSSNCSFTVTIHSVIPPSISVGCVNVTDVVSGNGCSMTPGTIQAPTLTDNCHSTSSLTLTYTMTGATTGSGVGSVVGKTFNAGVTTVTYTVSDPDGLTSSCTFTVSIIPLNAPAFTAGCPANITVDAEVGKCDAPVTLTVPAISDPCTIGYTVTNTGNANGRYPVGTTTITWTITPTIGAPANCTQTITVTDINILGIVCPPSVTASANYGVNYASPVAVGAPTVQPNCYNPQLSWVMVPPVDNSVMPAIDYATKYTAAELAGTGVFVGTGTYYVGTTTITYTVTDSKGTTATCSFTVTVTAAPIIDCPDDILANTDTGTCTYKENDQDKLTPTLLQGAEPITWTWNMTGATTASGTGRPLAPIFSTFNVGVTVITWTATNVSGSATCSHTVTVVDNIAPTFTMPGTMTECVENIQNATYDPATMDITPTRPDYYIFVGGSPGDIRLDISNLSDNCCGTASMTINWRIDFSGGGSISGTGQLSAHGSDIQFPGDTAPYDTDLVHTITYWVVDCHGNTSPTQTQTITIKPRPDVKKVP